MQTTRWFSGAKRYSDFMKNGNRVYQQNRPGRDMLPEHLRDFTPVPQASINVPKDPVDMRVSLLLTELAELKSISENNLSMKLQAEQALEQCNSSRISLLQELDQSKRSYELDLAQSTAVQPSVDYEKLLVDLREELQSWKDASEEYLTSARNFEARLRDAQIKHREDEMDWHGKILEARQTGTLPLIVAVACSAGLTFLIYHGKTLLDHRKNVLIATEREREWLDQLSQVSRKYEDALSEISRLRSTKEVKKWSFL